MKDGQTPREVAKQVGYSASWVREVVRRWNEVGSQGISDHRRTLPGAKPLLSLEEQRDLAQALEQPPADGGVWSEPKVAAWMQDKLGCPVDGHLGWDYLQRLGYRSRVPHPEHTKADTHEQQAFKKTVRADRASAASPCGSRH